MLLPLGSALKSEFLEFVLVEEIDFLPNIDEETDMLSTLDTTGNGEEKSPPDCTEEEVPLFLELSRDTVDGEVVREAMEDDAVIGTADSLVGAVAAFVAGFGAKSNPAKGSLLFICGPDRITPL